ncbi:MAG: hypothetical protein KKE02_00605 [Alphaproteobacteria bacterium]|nr:hypothetical protein [Alphaproteobacteria bacterium]MBU1515689.1 hypothetical protein [Alphaproteobacteria bacterium]MBU2096972.1 hypothetical protein [Alphaproteobacteria bacterium]MBU2149488.1 hypothetical protein [Alphaproteobacteria bacterium]MBU2308874.1 hypothetical protein [Alphaproteobacteria bacterium]
MTDQVSYAANEDKTMPAVCYALYLLAFATGITAIIGLIIAYAQRASAGPAMQSHYTFLIRTFWIGLALMIAGGVLFGVGALLSVILIGFPIMGLAWMVMGGAGILYGVRCVVGLVFLSRGEAYPRPYAVIA